MIFKRLLVLAPHTDDAELGCGGSMARLLEEGVDIHVVAFSSAEESRPAGSEPYRLRREFQAALKAMGLPDDHVRCHDYPVRRFSYQRQEILEDLVALRRELAPDAVFLPTGSDLHQDHQVIAAEGLRAFKEVSVWGYELPWNHITFSANAFITLEPRHVEAKWQALQHYASQLELARSYFTRETVESMARFRGLQVKTTYAEAFELMRFRY
ncbi:MAG: N-acetylglucosaminylphosphatidylinositol deacetylase [Cyanobacteria bacterium RYN_339]|nr:N-acetylglucosaminylphosphatidylinositol deacetylase [Cyanobacteria bacterium RYN_339]